MFTHVLLNTNDLLLPPQAFQVWQARLCLCPRHPQDALQRLPPELQVDVRLAHAGGAGQAARLGGAGRAALQGGQVSRPVSPYEIETQKLNSHLNLK